MPIVEETSLTWQRKKKLQLPPPTGRKNFTVYLVYNVSIKMSEVFGPTARLERKVVRSSFSVGILSAWNS